MAMPSNLLNDAVLAQLIEIPAYPDSSGRRVCRPASAEHMDGRWLDHVVFVDCRTLGCEPRPGNLGYAIWPSEIRSVAPSPYAVPLDLYESTLGIGEAGHGFKRVGMTLRDGRRYAIGFVNEFPLFPLPSDAAGHDIESLEPVYNERNEHWDEWRGMPEPPTVWICEHL